MAEPNTEKPTCCTKTSDRLRRFVRNITVEPIMLCFDTPNVIAGLAMQHLNLEKACRVDLALNATVCDAIAVHNVTGFDKADEADVQRYVATAMAWRNVVQSAIPTLLVLFIGAWSDRHARRKPCMIAPLLGQATIVLGLTIATYYFYELSLWWNVFIEGVPPALTGGAHTLDMAVFAYISAVTTAEERTVRVGAVNLFITVAGTVGSAICGVLYHQLGFYGCYALTMAAYVFGISYTMVRIHDPPRQPDADVAVKKKNFCVDFFDVGMVRETLRVTFMSGVNNRRKRVISIMVLVIVIVGPMHGEGNVMYMFTRYKFDWSEIDYSVYNTYYAIVHIIGGVFSLILFAKVLKFDDAMLGMLSSMSKVLAAAVYAFAPHPALFYVAATIEMFNGCSFIAMRTIISKLVPAHELGKIYSIFSVCEVITPLIYGPMYSFIYKYTIDWMPGAFFLAGGLLTIPSCLIFYWLHLENQRDIEEAALPAQQDDLLVGKKLHAHDDMEMRTKETSEVLQA